MCPHGRREWYNHRCVNGTVHRAQRCLDCGAEPVRQADGRYWVSKAEVRAAGLDPDRLPAGGHAKPDPTDFDQL